MSKKRDKEEIERINATYDALFNNLADVPIEDVQRALEDSGIDRTALRERLHARANKIARGARAAGQAASPALVRLIDQIGDSTTLPEDPKRAINKAKQYMRNLFGPVATGPAPQIVGAFRSEGQLTDRDTETIEEIDAELQERAKAADEDES